MEFWWRHATRQSIIIAGCMLLWTALFLFFCYRFPLREQLAANGLGDQWFLQTTEAQRDWASTDGYVYPDEMDITGERFRWTRGRVVMDFPGLGSTPTDLFFDVTGWPTDTLRSDLAQPIVHVLVNGVPMEAWTPTPQRSIYQVSVPALGPDLQVDLRLGSLIDTVPEPESTSIFTATQRYPDERRPLGLRLYGVGIQSAGGSWVRPDFQVLGWTIFLCLLALMTARRLRTGILLSMLISGLIAFVIAWFRLWVVPILTILTIPLVLWLLWRWRKPIQSFWNAWRGRIARSPAWGWSVAGVASLAVVLWIGLFLRRIIVASPTSTGHLLTANSFVNFMVVASFVGALIGLLIIRWRELCRGLERANLRFRIRSRPGLIALGGVLLIWSLYMVSVIRAIPYLGSADYSDNGVVARNLVQGRGWVVDYVSQFYQLNPGGSVTRIQETWPLLQPVLIAPFFKMFGATVWAAKIPNILVLTALSLVVYHAASQLWDRRVGLLAVIFLILNQHYFRLQIYSTSDLAFALWYVAAMWVAWRAYQTKERRWWLVSGILIGLMCLQKPSGTIVAVGMGFWMIWKTWPWEQRWQHWRTIVLWWILPAILVFSPYMVRNMYEFGTPMYSTETYDAWILEYPGVGDAWEQIYAVMTPEAGLSETGGLPERSWILRWGFHRSYDKIQRQLIATRNYHVPYHEAFGPLAGKGELMGNLDLGVSSDPGRWLMIGSWLSLLGIVVLQRKRAAFMGFVVWSFVPYTIFLIVYWHANEQRYFVPIIPWLCILAGAGLWAIHDTIANVGRGILRPVAIAAVIFLSILTIQPGWVEARNKTSPTGELASWQADIAAFEWLRENTPEDAVVMTRVPWQLQFHAERPAVMVPYTRDQTTLLRIAEYYDARYLLVNAITNNKGDVRQALDGLLEGREQAGWKRVAAFQAPAGRTIYIYEFPADYNQVPAIELGS